ncbi:MAG: hypothetical protein J6A92_07940 [Lachnospiraceae bacterium]|nr:hypothetical protein [Lachnospiraceae bacterium]
MEIQFEPIRLESCAKQLDSCEKLLNRKAYALMEIQENICRINSAEGMKIVKESLKKQADVLLVQSRQVQNMQKVLRKAARIYKNCEEDILQCNETAIRQYEETYGMVHLEKMEEFKIVLK